MELILLERIDRLGSIGDVVSVRAGYARNYLLRFGKALRANAANRQRFEDQKEQIIARNAALRADSMGRAEAIDGYTYTVIRQSADTGRLYGSVSARDIAAAATEAGHAIDRREIRIDQPIKTIGVHQIAVRLHPEVVTIIRVNVARSADEAERQAAGEDVIASQLSERVAERSGMPRPDQSDDSDASAAQQSMDAQPPETDASPEDSAGRQESPEN